MKDRIISLKPNGEWEAKTDQIAEEEPLELRVGKKSLAVTMRTPGHDNELAMGFLLSESVVTSPKKILRLQHSKLIRQPENRLEITFAAGSTPRLEVLERYGVIHSSCGVCGKKSIEESLHSKEPLHPQPRFPLKTILEIPTLFSKAQKDFQVSGGIHAAALFDAKGKLLVLREDVGRHNAVDKVIGWSALNHQWPLPDSILMVSGRASFEIMQKAFASQIPLILAVSAPSTLAIQFARQSGQTLIGFLRPPTLNVYSHIENLKLENSKTS